MTVGSVLEMYVTHFGWIGFNVIMTLLMTTGILFVPLIAGIASAWFNGVKNTETRPGVLSSLRTIELKILSFTVVFFLCALPSYPLKTTELSVIPQNAGVHLTTPESSHSIDNDTSTLKKPMKAGLSEATSNYGVPNVPIYWMLVMQVSSGITHAAVRAVPETFDIKAAQVAFGEFSFQDQHLASELNEFIDDCFLVARGKFDRWTTNGQFEKNASAKTKKLLEKNPDMVNWIGSPIFRNTPGLYARCNNIDKCGSSPQASEMITGWPFDANRDGIRESTHQTNDPGQPYCKEWWDNDKHGLKKRILRESFAPGVTNNSTTALIKATQLLWNVGKFKGSLERARDVAVERAIQTSRVRARHRDNPLYGANNSADRNWGGFSETITGTVGAVGAVWTSNKAVVQGSLLKTASYILQGALLFIIYALLPFVMLFTSMSPATMLTGGLFIFGVKFMTVLWAWANFIENKMHEALFPDWPNVQFSEVFLNFGMKAEAESMYNIVGALMYVVFPMVWLMVVGLSGVQLSRGINTALSSTGGAASSATNAGMKGAIGGATIGRKFLSK